MKKLLLGPLVLLLICVFFSCSQDTNISSPKNEDNSVENKLLEIENSMDDNTKLQVEFGLALAKALRDSKELRGIIRTEALKMIDKDFDVLYKRIKNENIGDGDVQSLLEGYISDPNLLQKIETNIPTLTIFVPQLPEETFSAELWDVLNEIPKVVVRLTSTNANLLISPDTKEIIDSGLIPGFPVVVVKVNERIVVAPKDRSFNAEDTFKTQDQTEFLFLSESFNGIKPNEIKNSSKYTEQVYTYPKLVDAFEIYENQNGWQRDYVYYNLTPTNTRGQFDYDYQENLTHFSLKGNPQYVLNKISDQTADPDFRGAGVVENTNNSTSFFTDGNFEFKVKVVLGAKSGGINELVTYFPADPGDLFHVQTEYLGNGYYRSTGVILLSDQGYYPHLPLFSWNLNQYSSSVLITIEEVDQTQTFQSTETVTSTFANNFSFNFGITEKIGLEFGLEDTETVTQSYQTNYSVGNDELGSVIINFGDDVISKVYDYTFFGHPVVDTREYYTGWYSIAVEPRPVNP